MEYAFVSGDVALDLTGTVQHRRTDATDLLVVPDDLSRWLSEARVVDQPVKFGADEFDRASERETSALGDPCPRGRLGGSRLTRFAVVQLATSAKEHLKM